MAIVTGKLPIINPYISQKSVPAVNNAYMYNEIPDVFFVRIVLIAWGKKDIVVPIAAKYPMMALYI